MRLLLGAALALSGCGAEPPTPDPPRIEGAATASLYLATMARPLEAYPEAGIRGRFRIAEGCAMLDEALLVFPHGTKLATTTAGGTTILFGGAPSLQLRPGMTVSGGGGHYDLASFIAAEGGWGLASPVPERCRRLTNSAVLVGPGARMLPPARHADRLYAAVQATRLEPGPLAPVGGPLRVENQCLLLGDALLVLPAESSVAFDSAGELQVRIAARYRDTIVARPGDHLSGSGGGLMAEDEPIPPMPRPLVEPIPERCRPPGRRGVMLNPGPEVTRAARTTYSDPAAADTAAVPQSAPPPPIVDPAACPAGSRLSQGFCRDSGGGAVRPRSDR